VKSILAAIELVDASVPREATYEEAARVLAASEAPTVAILDANRKVVGLFGIEQALRGCMPSYLLEVRHTAFAKDDLALLAERAREVLDDPVLEHAAQPVTVDIETSAVHVAQVFLQEGMAGIAVVEDGRYAGVLGRAAFARAMLKRALAGGEA
jgi:CBS-domain-containing membrane protein